LAHKAALISWFVSHQPDTSLHFLTTDMGLMHHVFCMFSLLASFSLIAPSVRLCYPSNLLLEYSASTLASIRVLA